MNLKFSIIIVLIALIVISIKTEFTDEQRICNELSGQSSTQSASEDFLRCEDVSYCKSIKLKESSNDLLDTSSGLFSYNCVHIDTDETIHPQKFQTLIK